MPVFDDPFASANDFLIHFKRRSHGLLLWNGNDSSRIFNLSHKIVAAMHLHRREADPRMANGVLRFEFGEWA
jgi:hypothetical protein